MKRCARHTGVVQVPQVECPDGTWLVDSTLIIEHYERLLPEPAIRPRVAAVAFVSELLEDFGDEWLWRPAMHYRWSFPANARLMSAWLAEHPTERRAPQWVKRLFWRRRQYGTFVAGDGVDATTRAAVEETYLATLAALEAIFATRPYVLGERPTEADFGFFASMFRHFACDPAPGRVMRTRAPGVHEWVARMWNLRPERVARAPLPDHLPDDLGALLEIVTAEYLPYLEANARAFAGRRGARALRDSRRHLRGAHQAVPRLVPRPAAAVARSASRERARERRARRGRTRRARAPRASVAEGRAERAPGPADPGGGATYSRRQLVAPDALITTSRAADPSPRRRSDRACGTGSCDRSQGCVPQWSCCRRPPP